MSTLARRLATGACLTLISLVGCSLYLDWSPEGLPCSAEKECDEGYTCLAKKCVADGSRSLYATCSETKQCDGHEDGVICGSTPYACRKKCNQFFQSTGVCESETFCRPERDPADDSKWIGTCYPPVGDEKCSKDNDCSGKICVQMTATARYCMPACEYDYTSGSYGDNCASSPGMDLYCQAIGMSDQQRLVCLENIKGAVQALNNWCDPVDGPCDSEQGLICHRELCKKLCTKESPCADTQEECIAQENKQGDAVYSVCLPTRAIP